MKRRPLFVGLATLLLHASGPLSGAAQEAPGTSPPPTAPDSLQKWTLEACVEVALQNNHRRPASQFAVAVAEAQHRQAAAGYWPQIDLKAGYAHLDEPPNFLFPASSFFVPPMSIDVPGGSAMVTIPADAFGPGFPPSDVQVPVDYPGQTINTPGGSLPIPEQDIKMMNQDSFLGSIQAKWLLFDGGMRGGWRQQAKGNLDMIEEEARRTDLEIVDSVTRLYYGAVLTRKLNDVGQETLERMEATLGLTETMYKEGSGRVKKTDYLDNKIMVETLRSAVALLEKNQVMAEAALAYTVGFSWDASIRPSSNEVPYDPPEMDLSELVSTAYRFNPDWGRLEAGIHAVEGELKTAKSGYFPKLALTGEIHKWWNDYDAGVATTQNKTGWSVGVGLELPLFNGFLTRNRVAEARAHLNQVHEEGFLLKEGIGLQVRNIFTAMTANSRRFQATLDAMTAAQENRDLNTRAYQIDMAETEDVIRAQLIEAFMVAQHHKMRYDQAELLSRLNLVVGTEVERQLDTQEGN